MNIFEQASKIALRFATTRGSITTEDLWIMPLTSPCGFSLDDLAKVLHKEIKDSEVSSFVLKQDTKNEIATLKFDIVKHIIDTKLAEIDAQEKLVENKEKKERILSIIAEKQDESLKEKSVDELKKLVEDL